MKLYLKFYCNREWFMFEIFTNVDFVNFERKVKRGLHREKCKIHTKTYFRYELVHCWKIIGLTHHESMKKVIYSSLKLRDLAVKSHWTIRGLYDPMKDSTSCYIIFQGPFGDIFWKLLKKQQLLKIFWVWSLSSCWTCAGNQFWD